MDVPASGFMKLISQPQGMRLHRTMTSPSQKLPSCEQKNRGSKLPFRNNRVVVNRKRHR